MNPTGMQIVESDEARQPLGVLDVLYFDETEEIILTLKSNPVEFYGLFWSDDLINFKPGINAAAP